MGHKDLVEMEDLLEAKVDITHTQEDLMDSEILEILATYFRLFTGGFGGRQSSKRQTGPRKGADLNVHVDISFEDAF